MGTHGHRRRGPKANYEEGSTGTLRVLTRPFPRLSTDHGLTAPHVGNARGLEAYLSGTRGALAVGSAAGTGRGRTQPGSPGRSLQWYLRRTPCVPREYPVSTP